MPVYVMLFNAGTEHEGIHTLSVGDHNIVLMFEEEDDATRYALLLEAQDFMVPSVERLDRREIESFCEETGYESQFVPKGFKPETEFDRLLIAPPQRNLAQPDWDANAPKEAPSQAAEEAGELSNSELDSIRRRLEGLL
jgi:hypothetical protein